MLVVIVLAPEHQNGLFPHQTLAHLPANIAARTAKVVGLRVGVPDVKHRARLHHRVGRGKGIAQELAELLVAHCIVLDGELVLGRPFVSHVVRRVGEQQVHQHPRPQQALHLIQARAVATQQPVLATDPHIARLGDGLGLHLGGLVGIGQALDRRLFLSQAEQAVEFVLVKAGQLQVEVQVLQVLEFQGQQFLVPVRQLRHAIDADAERLDLGVGQVIGEQDGDGGELELARGLEPQVAIDHRAVAFGDDGDAEAELSDRGGDAVDGVIVVAGISRVLHQPVNRPVL